MRPLLLLVIFACSLSAQELVNPRLIPAERLTPLEQALNRDVDGGQSPKTANREFWAVVATSYGMTALDVGFTHRCLSHGTCREGNPILTRMGLNSAAELWSFQLGLATGISIWSYYVKKKKDKEISPTWPWWTVHAGLWGAHAVGAAAGIQIAVTERRE